MEIVFTCYALFLIWRALVTILDCADITNCFETFNFGLEEFLFRLFIENSFYFFVLKFSFFFVFFVINVYLLFLISLMNYYNSKDSKRPKRYLFKVILYCFKYYINHLYSNIFFFFQTIQNKIFEKV